MRSFKKIFWVGLITLFVLWLIYKAGEMLYNFPKPIRSGLLLIIQKNIPGLEFVATFFFIIILGVIAVYLSNRASSKITLINQFIEFSKIVHDLSNSTNKGEIRAVFVEITPGVYRPGFTRNIIVRANGLEFIMVYLPNSPGAYTGQAHAVFKEKIMYLPLKLNKPMLGIITSGGLLKRAPKKKKKIH